MKSLKKIFMALLVASSLALFGSQFALAAEDAEGVAKGIDDTIKHTEMALESAEQGNADGVIEHVREARQHVKEITGDTIAARTGRASGRLRMAGVYAKKGDMNAAKQALTEALETLKSIQ